MVMGMGNMKQQPDEGEGGKKRPYISMGEDEGLKEEEWEMPCFFGSHFFGHEEKEGRRWGAWIVCVACDD